MTIDFAKAARYCIAEDMPFYQGVRKQVTTMRPRGETWRARAQQREGSFQAQARGIITLGEDGVVAYKAQAH